MSVRECVNLFVEEWCQVVWDQILMLKYELTAYKSRLLMTAQTTNISHSPWDTEKAESFDHTFKINTYNMNILCCKNKISKM